MFDHVGIFVSDPARSFPFYEHALAPLGILVRERQTQWGSIVMSGEHRRPFRWIGPAGADNYGTALKVHERRPMHLALRAPSQAAVEEFFRVGQAHGGRDNGAPADCGHGAYGAYLLDPDGNNVEAVRREFD